MAVISTRTVRSRFGKRTKIADGQIELSASGNPVQTIRITVREYSDEYFPDRQRNGYALADLEFTPDEAKKIVEWILRIQQKPKPYRT